MCDWVEGSFSAVTFRFLLIPLAVAHIYFGRSAGAAEPAGTTNELATKSPTEPARFVASALPAEQLHPHLDRGKDLYARNCLICHQLNGAGMPGAFPPLAKSDLLNGNLERRESAGHTRAI